MRSSFTWFTKSFSAFAIAAAIGLALAPTAGYGGILGTVAGGTLNVGASTTNFFDLSAVPGTAPIPALVVDPGVEYTGNQPALQTEFPGVTMHISADLNNSQILLTWINSGIGASAITTSTFTFDLFPVGQQVAGISFVFGSPPGSTSFGIDQVTINYGAFVLGGGASTFALYNLAFVGVPEPSTYLLLGSMAVLAMVAVRRKKSQEIAQQA